MSSGSALMGSDLSCQSVQFWQNKNLRIIIHPQLIHFLTDTHTDRQLLLYKNPPPHHHNFRTGQICILPQRAANSLQMWINPLLWLHPPGSSSSSSSFYSMMMKMIMMMMKMIMMMLMISINFWLFSLAHSRRMLGVSVSQMNCNKFISQICVSQMCYRYVVQRCFKYVYKICIKIWIKLKKKTR